MLIQIRSIGLFLPIIYRLWLGMYARTSAQNKHLTQSKYVTRTGAHINNPTKRPSVNIINRLSPSYCSFSNLISFRKRISNNSPSEELMCITSFQYIEDFTEKFRRRHSMHSSVPRVYVQRTSHRDVCIYRRFVYMGLGDARQTRKTKYLLINAWLVIAYQKMPYEKVREDPNEKNGDVYKTHQCFWIFGGSAARNSNPFLPRANHRTMDEIAH